MSHDDDLLFSRSPNPSPFGKCDGRLDVPAPDLLVEVAITLGNMAKPRPMPKAEFIRNHLERTLLGEWTCFRAKTHQLKADPLCAPDVSLDEALTALATLSGMSREAYIEQLLKRAVFGEFSMVRSVADEQATVNLTNVGLKAA